MYKIYKKAFTLIELSIVILVLSFLISLTLIGSKLQDSAVVQSIVQEHFKLKQSIIDFHKVYGELPGDFSDAQYNLTTLSDVAKTANVNTLLRENIGYNVALNLPDNINKNKLDSALKTISIASEATTYTSKNYLAWQHLGLSKILDTNYSGLCLKNAISVTNCSIIKDNNSTNPVSLKNIPESNKIKGLNIGYSVSYTEITSGGNANTVTNFGLDITNHKILFYSKTALDKNVILLSKYNSQNSNGIGIEGALSPNLMSLMDSKFDDGDPTSGNILALNTLDNGMNTCSTNNALCECMKNTNNLSDGDNITRPVYYVSGNKNNKCIAVFIIREFD